MGERGIDYIHGLLPNRYPLLLIDRVLEEGEDWVKVLKNVTINEPFFVGHFPQEPVMPGSLILEGMAQAAGVLAARSLPQSGVGYLVGVDRAKFRKPVRPGDQLIYEARLTRARGSFYHVDVVATVREERVAEAVIALAIPGQEKR
ncbi:TPA: 3-hydroxyacyl-[acyl-carrier-protein] dehydratase FabZ [Candidatus Acetothermia bacterium]|nr:3-hydroxyacyl-[acyl-carrier-protein] dehydratase FabZ [Candidatus Acetothermia bacterium]HAZ30716.1 3-hydroxyacyl-[acyl-carrier-protein] dehydratase FabZ [Candidatus Acetothermia bacterium]